MALGEPGASANARIRHARCWRTGRAGRRRGTSVTFGKTEPYESISACSFHFDDRLCRLRNDARETGFVHDARETSFVREGPASILG